VIKKGIILKIIKKKKNNNIAKEIEEFKGIKEYLIKSVAFLSRTLVVYTMGYID